ncbi:hypothetical protein [Candidatus Uabimicrobium amorphum]|uniref:Lipoprotein n=1 Tax=Uabimicrobium amorphum TaxID=2596890 RepID=A0A5S9IS27_UABAM|nr:hypothetical protein [Candidatus Uabimicrobium amorphum]BBM86566.1 hypothetical protein UABAM_04952 [Candidatus Uabimicrobium amorphum]
MKKNPVVYFAMLTFCLTIGCQTGSFLHNVTFPAYEGTYDIDGEQVEINMIKVFDGDNRNTAYESEYKTVFGESSWKELVKTFHEYEKEAGAAAVEALGAAAAAALVGLAVDYGKKKLEEEASLHVAQYEKRLAVDEFWRKEEETATRKIKYFPNYYAFEIVRKTTANEVSYRKVFGLAPSKDRSVFLVAPLKTELNSTKAKVSGLRLWSAIPIFWWHPLLLNYEDEIEIDIDVDIDAIWVDKNQKPHMDKRTFSTKEKHKLTFPVEKTGDGSNKFGWFHAIQRSSNQMTGDPGLGTFWINVRVTERDPSNAKKRLEQAAEFLGEQKETIVNTIVKTGS